LCLVFLPVCSNENGFIGYVPVTARKAAKPNQSTASFLFPMLTSWNVGDRGRGFAAIVM
jgi:hypothetical protein